MTERRKETDGRVFSPPILTLSHLSLLSTKAYSQSQVKTWAAKNALSFVCSRVVRISDFKEVFVIEKDAKRHLKFLKKRKKQLEKKLNDLASSKTLATDNARINFIFSFVRISSVYPVLV